MLLLSIFGYCWCFKRCTKSKTPKIVLVFVGGVPMSSDMSKCVNFSLFLDIAVVSKDAPSQKMHLIMLIGKWYFCW